jgi:hypothetical protein
MRISRVWVIAIAAGAIVAGCGGGANSPIGPVRNYSPTPAPTLSSMAIPFSIFIPNATHLQPRKAQSISSGTQSVSIVLASVNGQAVPPQTPTVINVESGASNCTVQSGGRQCTGTITGATGTDAFTIGLYSAQNAGGSLLAAGTIDSPVSGGATVALNNALSVTLNPIVASIQVQVQPNAFTFGVTGTASVLASAQDASGATIVGSVNGQADLTISGGGNAALTFPGQSSTATTPFNTTVTLTYDGDPNIGNSATVGAQLDGSNPPLTASATVAIETPAPTPTPVPTPTPIGATPTPSPQPLYTSLYVLNQGINAGQGNATVSVYAIGANGNATPMRNVVLNSNLTAGSVAVDAHGNLYVGYLEGEIDVYGPTENGSDSPLYSLIGDVNTSTQLEPVAMTFDSSGDLVTIGTTTINGGNGTTAEALVFRAGASGNSVDPINAWNFGSPYISLSGQTGGYVSSLATDGGGYTYVAGGLANSPLSNAPGIYVAPPGASGNAVHASRIVPDGTTTTIPTSVIDGTLAATALDGSGTIYESQFNGGEFVGGQILLIGQINVFSAGATGGTTNVAPVRSITGTPINLIVGQGTPALPIAVSGSNIYVANGSTNTVFVYSATSSGNAAPLQTIAGSNTQLDFPIGVAVGLSSSVTTEGRPRARAAGMPQRSRSGATTNNNTGASK